MDLRGNKQGSLSGLVLAGVGDNQTTVMDLTEFIQIMSWASCKVSTCYRNY